MRQLFRKPSPAMIVAALALFVALGGAGVAATGGNFILGQQNTADKTSDLQGSIAGPQLRVTNSNTAGTAIRGRRSATTGAQPAVQGDTASTSAGATGVYGLSSSASAAGDSNGVEGWNSGAGRGVYGQSNSGTGVYGNSKSQYGVWGIGSYGVVAGGSQGGVWSSTGNAAGSGVYGQNTASGRGVHGKSTSGVGVYGESGGQAGVSGLSGGFDGVYGETKSANFAGVSGHGGRFGVWGLGSTGVYGQSNDGGFALQANGNAGQGRGWGGWVKAMLYWDPHQDSHIVRCFNSQLPPTQATTPPCGFQALSLATGLSPVDVNFGFRVTDRFMMVTPVRDGGDIAADLEDATDFRTENWIRVTLTYSSLAGYSKNAKATNAPFYLVVF